MVKTIFCHKKTLRKSKNVGNEYELKATNITNSEKGKIYSIDVARMYFYLDEHTTATNGSYELREALEQEFKNGTYNHNYRKYFPPIFNNMKAVNLEYCNSQKNFW